MSKWMAFRFGKIQIQITCSLDHTHVDGRYGRCFEHGRFVGFMNFLSHHFCSPGDGLSEYVWVRGGREPLAKVTEPASWEGPRFSTEFWPISRVPRTGPTTQTCSVNNFLVTSAFLNLNSSCESRDQMPKSCPFQFL